VGNKEEVLKLEEFIRKAGYGAASDASNTEA
jgi:hypothetical protein